MKGQVRKSFHLPESVRHYRTPKDFRVEHIKVELALDFERKAASGACTIVVSPIREGVGRVSLDAVDMSIGKVSVDGKESEYAYDGEHIDVDLRGELKGKRTIRVEYATTPKEGIYFTAPDEGHPEKETQAWTHNEAEFARYWFPCFDHPDEKSTSELVLRVPKGLTVISNGTLVSSKDEGGQSVFHWKEDLPHPTYLTSFVAGKLGRIEQESQGVLLGYNFPESKRQDVLRYFGETPRMIEVFGELTGVKYPYSKYDQTTVQDFIYGGMENFNATTLAMNYYPDAGSEEDFQTSYSSPQTNAVNLVAHELAHQWFGDLVTCADWSHAWLNEAFATYLQVLYLEKTRGVDDARWDLEARAQQYFDEDEKEYRRAIVDNEYIYADDLFDMATYEKGASMIHQLRFLMGDKAFFDGIREYLKSYSFRNADTHELLRSLESTSGLSLQSYFEQAFHRPGHPEFEVEFSWDPANSSATVAVKQVQEHGDGTPVFMLPCEIVFYVGGKRFPQRVEISSADQSFTFVLQGRPEIVEFDPRRWLLKKVRFEKGLDLLRNQLEGSEDAWSRAEAAKALGRSKSDGALATLSAAAEKEQFWDVRASSLRAIGEVGSSAALEVLLKLKVPKDRRVRRGLAEALGNFKEARAREMLVRFLTTDESPYVRCEAALALAKAWPEGCVPHLKEAMSFRSPNDTLTEACLEAMGKVKSSEVDRLVMESLAYGKPTRVRIGALRAIKGRGYVLDDEVPVLKDMLLKDKEFRVRQYIASTTIREVGDRRFLDATKESSQSDKDPRVRRKALETYYELAASVELSTAVNRLKSEVERLKEDNARLANRAA